MPTCGKRSLCGRLYSLNSSTDCSSVHTPQSKKLYSPTPRYTNTMRLKKTSGVHPSTRRARDVHSTMCRPRVRRFPSGPCSRSHRLKISAGTGSTSGRHRSTSVHDRTISLGAGRTEHRRTDTKPPLGEHVSRRTVGGGACGRRASVGHSRARFRACTTPAHRTPRLRFESTSHAEQRDREC